MAVNIFCIGSFYGMTWGNDGVEPPASMVVKDRPFILWLCIL